MTTAKNIATLAVIVLFGFGGQLRAQNTASTNGYSKGNIVVPITLRMVAPMNFGSFIPPSTPGTGNVNVSHDPSVRGVSGGVTVAGTQGATEAPSDWVVTGQPNFLYAISYGGLTPPGGAFPSSFTMTLTSTTDNTQHMTLAFAGIDVTTGGATGFGNHVSSQNPVPAQLNATGNGAYSQGGVLFVPHGQAPGLYSGTWTETVTYN